MNSPGSRRVLLPCCPSDKRVIPGHEPGGAWLGNSVSTKSQDTAGNRDGLDEDEDLFTETPTIANRANPTASPSEVDKDAVQGLAGAGAYRMVRPAISDTLAPPAPTKRPSGNRVIIGVTRKS
jgi:hypothetical protein